MLRLFDYFLSLWTRNRTICIACPFRKTNLQGPKKKWVPRLPYRSTHAQVHKQPTANQTRG